MASYPGVIRVFTSKVDLVDVNYAAHINELQDEVVAVQNALGTNPNGGHASVKARIASLEATASTTGHTHAASAVTSGTLPVARGGTGLAAYTANRYFRANAGGTGFDQRTYAQVLADIGAAASGHNHDGTYVTEAGHTKAAHDALNINADTVDGLHAAAFSLTAHNHAGVYVTEAGHTKAQHDALNINADTVDGLHASAFSLTAHNHAGTYAPAVANNQFTSFNREGILTTFTGRGRLPFPFAVEVDEVRAMVNVASTGAAIIVDVNKNGTTILGATKCNIAGTNTKGSRTFTPVTFAEDDYLTIDVDQVGSTNPGEDLTVVVVFRPV